MAQSGSTPFVPSKHGFHFCNAFTNTVISSATANAVFQSVGLPAVFPPNISSPLWSTSGRCGGMAWLSLDYYFASQNVPTCVSACSAAAGSFDDFSSSAEVPPDGTPLADWIYVRLFDSFLNCGVQTLSWVAGYDHNTWFFGGVPEMTTSNEFPKTQKAIDSGTPVVLSVISWPSNAATSHQVVAYGYSVDDAGNMTVNIYDNRYADDDTVTLSAAPNQHWTIASSNPSVTPDTWKGWFVEGYSQGSPPFEDIVMQTGISGPPNVTNGDGAVYTFIAKNSGPYPAHPAANRIVGSTDYGEQFVLGPMNWPPRALASGASSQVIVALPTINWPQGVASSQVFLQAQFQTLEGWWDPVGATSSIPNTLTITMLPGLAAYIDVLSTTLTVDAINGVKTAIAKVTCSATSTSFAATPAFTWGVDGTNNIATGSTATLTIQCGTVGSINRTHTISVTATGTALSGGTASATASLQLVINPMLVTLRADYANSVVTSSSAPALSMKVPLGNGNGGVHGPIVTAYSSVQVDASCSGAYGAVSYAWQPANVQPGAPGVAMVPAPKSDLPEIVTVTATDEMFEVASARLEVQFIFSQGATSALATRVQGLDPFGQVFDARSATTPVALDESRAIAVVTERVPAPTLEQQRPQAVATVEKGVTGDGKLVDA
jgi:hypothetical protein